MVFYGLLIIEKLIRNFKKTLLTAYDILNT